jgi:hypothetical protein
MGFESLSLAPLEVKPLEVISLEVMQLEVRRQGMEKILHELKGSVALVDVLVEMKLPSFPALDYLGLVWKLEE